VICVRKQVVLGTIYFVTRHRQFAVNEFRMLNIKEIVTKLNIVFRFKLNTEIARNK